MSNRQLSPPQGPASLDAAYAIRFRRYSLGGAPTADVGAVDGSPMTVARVRQHGPVFWESDFLRPVATLVLGCSGRVVAAGRQVAAGDLIAAGAGARCESLVAEYVDFLEISVPDSVGGSWRGLHVVRAGPGLEAAARAVLAGTGSTEELRRLLAAVPDPAEPLHDTTTADGRAGDVVERSLRLIRHGWEGSVEDLAREVGTSRSGLYRSFARILSLSPADWIKLRRLNRLRIRLGTESDAVGRVSDLAIEEGLTHLGRLAQAYRRLFGELPSETARRGTAAGA